MSKSKETPEPPKETPEPPKETPEPPKETPTPIMGPPKAEPPKETPAPDIEKIVGEVLEKKLGEFLNKGPISEPPKPEPAKYKLFDEFDIGV